MESIRGLFRSRPKTMIAITLFVFVVLVGGISSAVGGTTKTVTKTVYQPVPGPTVTAQAQPAPTVTVTASPSNGPGTVIAHYTGAGNWNSPQFTVSGSSPVVKVSYSYWNNTSDGIADNFIADLVSGSDDNAIANTIASSGGNTTTLYPDTSFSGSNLYHLEIQATGDWSVTVTQEG